MDLPRRESEVQRQSFRGQSLNLHTALMTYRLHLNVKASLTGLAAQTGRGVDQSTDVCAPVPRIEGPCLRSLGAMMRRRTEIQLMNT
jgi:hypothetical protein